MTVDTKFLDAARKRASEWKAVRDGLLPGTEQLMRGSPFFRDSWQADAQLYLADLLLSRHIDDDLRAAVSHARDTLSIAALTAITHNAAIASLIGRPRNFDVRILVYRAAAGDEPASRLLIVELLCQSQNSFEWHRALPLIAVALGIVATGNGFTSTADAIELGMRVLSQRGEAAAKWIAAEVASVLPAEDAETFLEIELEPAASDKAAAPAAPAAADPLKVVVVPAMSMDGGSRDRKVTRTSFKPVAGIALPLVTRGDVGAHNRALMRRFPHASSVIRTLLGDLASREPVRFRPTILVGPPGYAKTSLATAICRQFGMPSVVYNAGGVSDSSLSGTSAQWSTAGASVPLQLVLQHKIANPCVIVDEVDKASANRHNGSMLDGLLAFLERSTSSAIRDPALEEAVDLSWVSWLMTANTTEGIPAPLRDRCRIIEMPAPQWRHVGDLARSILDDIATERDLDRRWIEDLAVDELELVRRTWSSGSIRKLRRIVETIVDGRENFVARV